MNLQLVRVAKLGFQPTLGPFEVGARLLTRSWSGAGSRYPRALPESCGTFVLMEESGEEDGVFSLDASEAACPGCEGAWGV
eukprot:scaffold408_cov388-Prasinococcus_capsulatus_cf.AAC.18